MIKLNKGVWIYIFTLILLSWLLQGFVIAKGGEEYTLFKPLIVVMMFFPGVGAIIYLFYTRSSLSYFSWKIGKAGYLLLALILPTAITLFTVKVIEILDFGVNTFFVFENDGVRVLNDLLLIDTGKQGYTLFLIRLYLSGALLSLMVGVLALGEELGWRGFLQKKLLEKNSLLKSIVFLGLLWALWHFPLVLNGFNFPQYPVLGAFLFFPVSTVCISVLMAWLTLNSGSIWPAVLVHGGINSIMSVLHSMDFGETRLEANITMLSIWGLVALITYFLISRNRVE